MNEDMLWTHGISSCFSQNLQFLGKASIISQISADDWDIATLFTRFNGSIVTEV